MLPTVPVAHQAIERAYEQRVLVDQRPAAFRELTHLAAICDRDNDDIVCFVFPPGNPLAGLNVRFKGAV